MDNYANEFIQGFGITGMLTISLISIFYLIAEWKIYEKAGKPGWAILIPIYRAIVFLEIIEKPWWWLLLFLIPGINVIFLIWSVNLLSVKFGKGVGFTLGLIFLAFIFVPILAFGDAKYIDLEAAE